MNKKLVSVIMPVYNAEQYLKDTLTDMQRQKYSELEIIIVDDGSTDGSWEIIKEFSERDTRIKCIKGKNKGVSNARNIGLELATGEYIRFIDADDRIPAESISELVSAFENNAEVDLVIGNYKTVPEQNYFTGGKFHNIIVNQNDFTKEFVKNPKSFYYGVPWNKLYKRSVIEENKIRFDENVFWCEDLLFNLEYYEKCRNILLMSISEGVYVYHQRDYSITSTLSSRGKEKMEEIEKIRYKKVVEFCEKQGLENELRLEWKYSNLYYKLNESVRKGYKSFKELLLTKDVYVYISQKQDESAIWRMIKKYIDRNHLFMPYIIFWVKDKISNVVQGTMPTLKENLRRLLPKSY